MAICVQLVPFLYQGNKRGLGLSHQQAAYRQVNCIYGDRASTFKYVHHCPLTELVGERLFPAVELAAQFIEPNVRQGRGVFVYCRAGRNRSVTVCLHYLTTRCRMPLAEALSLVQAANPRALPDAEYLQQLSSP